MIDRGRRYYDPAVGRFLSADPLGCLSGPNRYGHADNDPVNGIDPSGLVTRQDVVNGIRSVGTSIANGVSYVLSTAGRLWDWYRHRYGKVTLQAGTPRLGTANPAVYPELHGAGKEIDRFPDNEEEGIANQVFHGVVSKGGRQRARIGWISTRHRAGTLWPGR